MITQIYKGHNQDLFFFNDKSNEDTRGLNKSFCLQRIE